MDWFRHYHKTATEPKFHRIKLRVGCPRGLVCGVWWAILEFASEATPRGTIAGFSAADLAYLADVRLSLAEKLLQAFRDEGLITPENVVANWAKRQKNSDNVAERVSKHRARSANPLETHEVDPPGNVTVTYRTEQSREDSESPSSDSQANAHSVPLERADEPPKAQPSASAKAALWLEMKARIGGKRPGALVAKWCRDYGDGEVFASHFEAEAKNPADYVPWMTATLQARAGRRVGASAKPRASIAGTMEILNRSGFFDDERPDTPEPDGGGADAAARGLPFHSLN